MIGDPAAKKRTELLSSDCFLLGSELKRIHLG
jgi:hypothetical protein